MPNDCDQDEVTDESLLNITDDAESHAQYFDLHPSMRKKLRMLAVFVLVVAFVTWMATGANRGWTKTSEPVKILDEITGIEGITYQQRLAPGLDFLGAGLLAAGILTGASFLFCKKSNQTKTQP